MATEPSTVAATTEIAAVPNPKRVAAGQRNRAVRGPLTEAGRERLRAAAHLHRPWEHSTGPRSPDGKKRAAFNGKSRQIGVLSVRELRDYKKRQKNLLETLDRTLVLTTEVIRLLEEAAGEAPDQEFCIR